MMTYREAIKTRLEEATKGPWLLDHGGQFDLPRTAENRRFIFCAHKDLTTLLVLLEKAEARIGIIIGIIANNTKGSYRGTDAGSIAAEAYTEAVEALASLRAVLDTAEGGEK